MQTSQTRPPRTELQHRSDAWQNSETLFLLKCYDVWSATPPRGCKCGDVALAADRP